MATLEKIAAFAFGVFAIAALGLMLIVRIRMRRPDFFAQIRAGTNPDVRQLWQLARAPPKWIALLLLIAGVAIAALNLAMVRAAVQSGHIVIRNVTYAEAQSPAQFWLHVGRAGCIAGLTASVALWSIRALFRRGANRHDKRS